jgi:hypothetical protein
MGVVLWCTVLIYRFEVPTVSYLCRLQPQVLTQGAGQRYPGSPGRGGWLWANFTPRKNSVVLQSRQRWGHGLKKGRNVVEKEWYALPQEVRWVVTFVIVDASVLCSGCPLFETRLGRVLRSSACSLQANSKAIFWATVSSTSFLAHISPLPDDRYYVNRLTDSVVK